MVFFFERKSIKILLKFFKILKVYKLFKKKIFLRNISNANIMIF